MNNDDYLKVSERLEGLSMPACGITLNSMSLHMMQPRPFASIRRFIRPLVLPLALMLVSAAGVMQARGQDEAPAQARGMAEPAQAAGNVKLDVPIMKLADVRIGMKGYGLTVFHGTKVEPFAVEVISIQNDFAAGRGVVWVRCPDKRMQLSGPVHGMSGSPIFLWPLGEEGELGQGGRVIGAFAFGYQYVKDCYVGIQPIEYMIEAAGRMNLPAPDANQNSREASAAASHAGNPAEGTATLRRLIQAGAAKGYGPDRNWQATMLANALDPTSASAPLHAQTQALKESRTTAAPSREVLAGDDHLPVVGRPQQMLMPMQVGSPATATFMADLLEPLGIEPLASPGGSIAGAPPAEIDPAAVRFSPGSVLAVPLAWGDMDLSASGTVTALSDKGHVLGFGHAMFGDGATALPMATGYVHFVMPNVVSSFKLGGSLQLKGSLVRDEQAAVVGAAGRNYTTAPVRVNVTLPGQPVRQYRYEVVHHRSMTPILCAIVAMQSITAVQNPPTFNTMQVKATLRFNEKQVVNINTLIPMADPQVIASQLMPALVLMADNPYESRQVQAVDVDIEYLPQVLAASLTRGQISKSVVKPGEQVDITLWLQPYGGQLQRRHVSIQVPHSQPDGDYQLIVGGAQTYMGLTLGTRPHLSRPRDLPSLFNLIKRVLEADNTAIYCLLESPEPGLAVGMNELPGLPSSKRAMLTASASTFTSPYMQWIENVTQTRMVVQGNETFTLHVRRSGQLTEVTP